MPEPTDNSDDCDTQQTVLVTGTLAVDTIAEVADGFFDGDLNGKLHIPNAYWGGCGMNLAYGLARAGVRALPWVFYGEDCPAGYLQHIRTHDIDARLLVQQPGEKCAAAYIFTRADGSQLTGFFPGSVSYQAPDAAQTKSLAQCRTWIAGPEDDATLLARLEFIPKTTTLYWMPGQYAEVTRANVLEPMLARRPNLIVNAKEWQALNRAVGETQLLEQVEAVFITRGESGVSYRATAKDSFQERPTRQVTSVDPTGCGDAFCSALVAKLTQNITVAEAVDHAQAQAAACLTLPGSQGY